MFVYLEGGGSFFLMKHKLRSEFMSMCVGALPVIRSEDSLHFVTVFGLTRRECFRQQGGGVRGFAPVGRGCIPLEMPDNGDIF